MGKEGRKENTSVSSLTCKLNYLKHFVNDCGHISSNRTKSEPSWMPKNLSVSTSVVFTFLSLKQQ